ncbi:hypothetical protein IV203_007835 [Nitzschia inconspicua]|uniref:Transmembrane protein n=1 Tax=Nitzschia inconspicua TaxID=303405 RepID=A0A9K3KYG1_9STRA|nr:hypothetical protein IV203_007835 [Nitzschia inconspicua]
MISMEKYDGKDDDDHDAIEVDNKENLAQPYDVFSDRDLDESILSFLKTDDIEGDDIDDDDDDDVDDEDVMMAQMMINDDDTNDKGSIFAMDRSYEIGRSMDDDHPETTTTSTSACSRLFSNTMFLFGATLYVWTSYYVYDYYQRYGTVPREDTHYVVTATTNTDVTQVDDMYDFFFQVNSNSTSSFVTLYMAYTFATYLCWTIQGLWNCFFLSHGGSRRGRVQAILWTLAGLCGMTSSALVLKEPNWSEILNIVRTHLFAISALFTCCITKPESLQNMQCGIFSCCCCTPVRWLRLADAILSLSTLADVVLVYMNLWKDDDWMQNTSILPIHLLYAAMASAGGWALAALIYSTMSVTERFCYSPKQHFENNKTNNNKTKNKSDTAKNQQQQQQKHDEEDDDDDEESQESRRNTYLPEKTLTRGPTDDTANDDASVSSFSSWWTAGPQSNEGIARSSLDNIFGRVGDTRKKQ